MIYNGLLGKNRKEILQSIELAYINDSSSEVLIFYLGKSYFWQKKFLYVFFEKDKVVRSSIIFKNIWDKSISYD